MSKRAAYHRKTEQAARSANAEQYDDLQDVAKACDKWDVKRTVKLKRQQMPRWHKQWQPKVVDSLRILLIRASASFGVSQGLIRRSGDTEGWEDWVQDGEKNNDAERVKRVVEEYRKQLERDKKGDAI